MDLKLPRGVNLLLGTGIQYKYFWSWLSDRTKSASSSQGGFVLFLGLLPSPQGWAVRPTALWVLYWSRTRLAKFTDLTYMVWPTYVQPVLGWLPSSWLGREAGNTWQTVIYIQRKTILHLFLQGFPIWRQITHPSCCIFFSPHRNFSLNFTSCYFSNWF